MVSTRLRLRLRTRLPSEVIRGHQRSSEAPFYLPRLGELDGEIARDGAPVVEEHGAEVFPGDETGDRLLWGREEEGGRRGKPLHAGVCMDNGAVVGPCMLGCQTVRRWVPARSQRRSRRRRRPILPPGARPPPVGRWGAPW